MPKKMLVKLEEGVTATSVAVECAALLDAGLDEQLGPASPDEDGLAEGGRLAVRAAKRLLLLKHNYEAASEAVSRIGDELHRWRTERNRANAVLYKKAKGLREACRGMFDGDEGDTFLGIRGTLPREPKPLHTVLGPVVRRLADFGWPIPELKHDYVKIDRDELATDVIKAHGQVGTALEAIQQGETQEKVAEAAQQRAKKAYRVFLGKSCRFLEASLELAGLDELAAQVRPNVGRRGRPPKELPGAAAVLPGDGKALPAASAGELPSSVSGEEGEGEDSV